MANPFSNELNVMRVPKNPFDRSTVISAYSKTITQKNHSMNPGTFIIPGAVGEDISTITVGSSSWVKFVNVDEPLLEIVVPSREVARSIVDDYCSGLLGADANSRPALFWVDGEMSKDEIKKKYAAEIATARAKQRNWYQNLVVIADQFWVQSNHNPKFINDDMREAAKLLNLLDKEWIKDTYAMDYIKCRACKTLIEKDTIICPKCNVILNQEEFKKLNLAFAGSK